MTPLRIAAVSAAALLLVLLADDTLAFTTEDLVRLKRSGISEETIVFLVENGCSDAERILRLVEAGFKEETIRAIVKAEARTNRLPGASGTEPAGLPSGSAGSGDGTPGTAARVRIDWYMMYRGEPLRRNYQVIADAMVFLDGVVSVRVEDRTGPGSGVLDLLRKKPFPDPFVWDLEGSDSFGAGRDGFACALTSAVSRAGRPAADGMHFWVLSLQPNAPGLCESVRQALAGLKGGTPAR